MSSTVIARRSVSTQCRPRSVWSALLTPSREEPTQLASSSCVIGRSMQHAVRPAAAGRSRRPARRAARRRARSCPSAPNSARLRSASRSRVIEPREDPQRRARRALEERAEVGVRAPPAPRTGSTAVTRPSAAGRRSPTARRAPRPARGTRARPRGRPRTSRRSSPGPRCRSITRSETWRSWNSAAPRGKRRPRHARASQPTSSERAGRRGSSRARLPPACRLRPSPHPPGKSARCQSAPGVASCTWS